MAYRTVHGYRRAFVLAGPSDPRAPVLLLVHGIGDSSDTWLDLIPSLAADRIVIAPDLLGHGRSDKPRADYSVAAFANGLRDLIGVLGIERVTVVGHSLGGGVAMQFAYQYPTLCERLVLVSTGGVGREVHPALRLVAAPNADAGLHLLRTPFARPAARLAGELLRRLGTDIGQDADQLLRIFDAMPDATSRAAIVRTLRAVVDWRGQMVTMLDRAYLARSMPVLLVWGDRDAVIPVRHARVAHAAMPGSRLEIISGAGHFPHHADSGRFAALLLDFLAGTGPSEYDTEHWRELLRRGRPGEYSDARAALTEQTIDAATRSGT